MSQQYRITAGSQTVAVLQYVQLTVNKSVFRNTATRRGELKRYGSPDKMNSNCCLTRLSTRPRRFTILSLGHAGYIWYTSPVCCDGALLFAVWSVRNKKAVFYSCHSGCVTKCFLNPNTCSPPWFPRMDETPHNQKNTSCKHSGRFAEALFPHWVRMKTNCRS